MSKITEQHRDGNGELHRIGGPAVIYPDGNMSWYCHGKRHRRGGPASIFSDGTKFWRINGRYLRTPEQLPERAHSIMELFL